MTVLNELKIEERLTLKAASFHIPLKGGFELTPLCNMNCSMCYIRLTPEEMKKQGTLKSADEWISIAKEMKESGTLFILLTGGEPFLYHDFIPLYKGLKELGMSITINTNATNMTDEIVEVLSKDQPRRVNITLYGASNETYEKLCHMPDGFDKTIKGIKRLLDKNISIKLNASIVPENVHEIEKLQEIADHYDLPIKMDTYMYPNRKISRLTPQQAANVSLKIKKRQMTPQQYESYRQQTLLDAKEGKMKIETSCLASKCSFWIRWNGEMTPCVFMKKPAVDVFQKGFEASWKKLIQESQNILLLPHECQNCDKRKVCQVCYACVYCENEDPNQTPSYMCQYTEEIIKELEGDIE